MTDAEVGERRERADALLWSAIMEHADAYQLSRDGEFVNHFGIIVHWQPEVSTGDSRYTAHFHTPQVPDHVARGLFHTGLKLVDDTRFAEDDE